MDIQKIAKEYQDYLIEMRRWFHAHPEIAEKEFETSAMVQAELTKYGISGTTEIVHNPSYEERNAYGIL